jgi:hypothetical protein
MASFDQHWDTDLAARFEADWDGTKVAVLMVLAISFARRFPEPGLLHQAVTEFALKLQEKSLIEAFLASDAVQSDEVH